MLSLTSPKVRDQACIYLALSKGFEPCDLSLARAMRMRALALRGSRHFIIHY